MDMHANNDFDRMCCMLTGWKDSMWSMQTYIIIITIIIVIIFIFSWNFMDFSV